jgi:hypothetical protein
MGFTETLHIACPPTTAFDMMADIRHEKEWNDRVSRAELRTDEPIGKGSQFVVVSRGRPHDATITVFDPPDRLEFVVRDMGMDIDIRYTFAGTDGGTTAVGTFVAHPRGVMKMLVPVLTPVIKRGVAKQLVNFKRLCEKQPRAK